MKKTCFTFPACSWWGNFPTSRTRQSLRENVSALGNAFRIPLDFKYPTSLAARSLASCSQWAMEWFVISSTPSSLLLLSVCSQSWHLHRLLPSQPFLEHQDLSLKESALLLERFVGCCYLKLFGSKKELLTIMPSEVMYRGRKSIQTGWQHQLLHQSWRCMTWLVNLSNVGAASFPHLPPCLQWNQQDSHGECSGSLHYWRQTWGVQEQHSPERRQNKKIKLSITLQWIIWHRPYLFMHADIQLCVKVTDWRKIHMNVAAAVPIQKSTDGSANNFDT